MNIEICKWYGNKNSPVLLFIDDLANVWVDTNDNGKIDLGEDWGYGKNSENSSFRFLNEVILKDFPQVKVTFFVPVGIRVGMIESSKIKFISKMINCDEETKQFFKSINDNYKYEIAYHGTTHGKAGKTVFDFKQEWILYRNLDEAIKTINKGKKIYKDVFGEYPKGGKYCGYETNEFSDESIDKTEFLWWCRYWNRGITYNKECTIGGIDFNTITNFDIKTFGENQVVDIPSTVDGGLLTGILNPNIKTVKGIVKKVLKKYLLKNKLRQIDYLLKNKLVISIQEHISPLTNAGGSIPQTPNIFNDKESLQFIFNYLKDKNIWCCTATELAEYYWLREHAKIQLIDSNKFIVKYNGEKKIKNKKLTLRFDNDVKKIKLPDLRVIESRTNCFDIDVLDGIYEIL